MTETTRSEKTTMAWQIKQHATGYFYAENQNGDTTDQTWTEREPAEKWASETNERMAKQDAERKARAAARKPRTEVPTQFRTSRGDGWESNGK